MVVRWCLSVILLLSVFLHCEESNAQLFSKNGSRKHYKVSRASSSVARKQCSRLRKKKYARKKHRISFASSRKHKTKPLAEYDPNDTSPTPKPAPDPKPKPEPVASNKTEHTKSFNEMNLDEKHEVEDEVLAKNNLPQPTSKKHEEIRKNVENHLKGHKKGEPIKLKPLYFTFDEDEFSVVDMEPFLVAVEYALQGFIVLIEGHTDSHGADDYNMKLSIKRVEKIRQLMQDMGVPDDRISIVGYGEEVGTHDNSSEEGREKNRRVDFTVF